MRRDFEVFDFSDLADILEKIIEEELTARKNEKQTAQEQETTSKKKTKKNIVDRIDMSVYISHPFSGNEEENILRAETLAAELVKSFPNIAFFNPLSEFRYLEKAKLSYDDCMKHCLYWLHKCDGVLMAPNWEKSAGCQRERKEAINYWMPVWNSVSQFADAMYHHANDNLFDI